MPEKDSSFNRKQPGCDDFFLLRCKTPCLSDLVNTVEAFWQFEPFTRDRAILLHAAELKISGIYFYSIARHIADIEAMEVG